MGSLTDDDEIIDDSLLRAYFKIWYDYYRDENLQVEVAYLDKQDDPQKLSLFDFWRAWRRNSNILEVLDNDFDAYNADKLFADIMNNFEPFYRAFKKDYFTAALPTPQKGEEVKLLRVILLIKISNFYLKILITIIIIPNFKIGS